MPDLVLTIIVGVLCLSSAVVHYLIWERIQSKPTAEQLMINFLLAIPWVIFGIWFLMRIS